MKLASLVGVALLLAGAEVRAEWRIATESQFFYTNDAGLFSLSRRNLKDQDPTQPAFDFDLGEQGSDFVYEPAVEIVKTFPVLGGEASLGVRAQAFVFGSNSEYDHASVAAEARWQFRERASIFARYFFISKLLLGENEVRLPESEEGEEEPELFEDEELVTHIWAMGLSHPLHDRVVGTLLGRVGIRRYDQPFNQRDAEIYTGGIHLDFDLSERSDLTLGFHYERGLADGRNGSERSLRDDVSYENFFVTGELEVELLPRLGFELALHYDKTKWTTDITGDERDGEHEDQFQGDIAFVYELSEIFDLTLGVQGVYRKESFEDSLDNVNTWFAVRASF